MTEQTIITSLAAALAAAQAELADPVREKRGQVKGKSDYRYAGLDDLLGAVRPVLAKHGIAITQPIVYREGRPYIVSTLMHGSGATIESAWELRNTGTPQDRGSEITYARRYTLEGLVCVAATADDDGAAASGHRRQQDDRDDRREQRNERPVDEDGVPHGSAGRVPPAEERRPRLTDDEIARRLATANLTLDEANWFAVTKSGAGLPLAKLDDEQLAKAVAYLTSTDGAQRVADGIAEVRDAFRNTWFAKWGLLYPTPRKKDGATDEGIAAAEARSETDRKAVLRAWYGVESGKQIGIRALLKGERNLDWLKHVPPNEFERAVVDTLRADSAQAAK